MNETTETTTTPTPEPKRLERVKEGRILTGAAAGIGRYLGIDANLVRIGFVVIAFVGGAGFLAYIAAAVLLPGEGGEKPIIKSLRLPWRSGAGRVALGATFIMIAAAAVLGGTDVLHWDTAAGLGIIGLGAILAVSAFAGGARWLIVPALALVLPLGIVAATDIDLDGGVGEREYRPTSVAELRDQYEIGIGAIDLDLTGLDLPTGRTDVDVDVGLGEAVIYVPNGVCVTSDIDLGAGEVDVFDRENNGFDVSFAEAATPPAGRPQLHIHAEAVLAGIEVVREGSQPDLIHRDRFFNRSGDVSSEGGTGCT
jgi:phage shock protein PspC (stress-responsive transcriptional regulator)